MIYQQTTFGSEQESQTLPVYQGGSPASRTALQESVKRLVMHVTFGQKCGELLAKLDPSGWWLKMFGGYSLAKMDGSFSEFCETLPKWGTMLDGELRVQPQLEPYIDESAWQLLPTPTATDVKGGSENYKKKGVLRGVLHNSKIAKTTYPNPVFLENMMGFPAQWTELEH